MASGDSHSYMTRNIAHPSRVPNVPGALGASPTPNPRAMKCAGWATRKRASGALEVVVSAAIDLHRLAVGAEQAHALAALDLPHPRDRDPEHVGQVLDALAGVRVRGEAKLVVVPAREDGVAALVRGDVLGADGGHRHRIEIDRGAD